MLKLLKDIQHLYIADVMTQKYVNGTLLYRQAESWNRQGVAFHRNTLSNWIILVTRDWLIPVYNACIESLMKEKVIHANETTVQALKEPGIDPTSNQ